MDKPRISYFNWDLAHLEHRDNLPHIRQANVIYFVTFRLADSLPAERVAKLRSQRDEWLARNPEPHTFKQQQEYRQIWTVRIERLLDAGYGACVLRDEPIRRVVEDVMRWGDAKRYRLGAYVIMPNHVHALLQQIGSYDLADTMKAWKSASARSMGKVLGRRGSYWMDEYFDHAVRNQASLQKFVRYIQENPKHLPPADFALGSGSLQSAWPR